MVIAWCQLKRAALLLHVRIDNPMKISFHQVGDDINVIVKSSRYATLGGIMSTMLTTFSCLKCLRSLISRKIRFASISSAKAFGTILMATFLSWFLRRCCAWALLLRGLLGKSIGTGERGRGGGLTGQETRCGGQIIHWWRTLIDL